MVDTSRDGSVAESEETVTEATDGAAKKGGGLVKIIVLVVIVVVALVGGWFGAQMFFFQPPPEEEVEEPVSNGAAAAETDSDIYDPLNPPGVLEFSEPFLIRLRRAQSLLRGDVYLKINLTLEVASEETKVEMESNDAVMSRISDSIITFFANQYPEDVETSFWPKLKNGLKEMINAQFPESYWIKRVNFREFVVQSR